VIVDVAIIAVTYTRLPPEDLYRTSVGGLRGGLSRALVELNFPLALIALGLLTVAANALLDSHRRLVIWISVIAIPLCALTGVVVDQSDLDATPRNAFPAIGVALIAVLTVIAVRANGAEPTLDWENDKPTVVALREIAAGNIGPELLEEQEAPAEAAIPDMELPTDFRAPQLGLGD